MKISPPVERIQTLVYKFKEDFFSTLDLMLKVFNQNVGKNISTK